MKSAMNPRDIHDGKLPGTRNRARHKSASLSLDHWILFLSSPKNPGPQTDRVCFGPGPLRFGVGSDPCHGEPKDS